MARSLLDYRPAFGRMENLCGSSITLNGYYIQLLGIHLMLCEPGWHADKHSHSFYELHYVEQGSCETTINNISQMVCRRQFYIIQPGAVHTHLSREGHSGFSLRWSIRPASEKLTQLSPLPGTRQELHDLFHDLARIAFIPFTDDNCRFMGKLQRILADSACQSLLQMQLAIFGLLLDLPELTGSRYEIPAPAITDSASKSEITDRCIKYIADNYPEKIRSTRLAASLHLSYGHISRVFNEVMGMSLNEYINLVRLRKAQYYLRSGNDNLREIAAKTGFSHENHLAGLFKSRFGLTPTEYRKSQIRFDE